MHEAMTRCYICLAGGIKTTHDYQFAANLVAGILLFFAILAVADYAIRRWG